MDILAGLMLKYDLALSGSFMLCAVLGADWCLSPAAKTYLQPSACADLDLFVRDEMPTLDRGLRECMKGLGYLRRTPIKPILSILLTPIKPLVSISHSPIKPIVSTSHTY